MKSKISAIIAIAALCAVSAVSCGNDAPEDSSVPDLPVLTTASEEETEETTAAKEGETTAASPADTTDTAETTSSDETTTEAVTEASQQDKQSQSENNNDKQPENNGQQSDNNGQQQSDNNGQQPDNNGQQQAPKFSIDNLNSDASSIISALGSPNDVQTAQGCLSNGADQKIYYYDGLTISCYVMNGTEYIYDILIENSNHSTSSGITVGSSRGDVESAYGSGESSGNFLYYYSGDSELGFEFDGDTVKSIDFYTAV